ncbi:hypothetical protein EBR66_05780 [bacterium]|nr:hypothetical protein [bacterium]
MEFKASAEEIFRLGDISDYTQVDDLLPIGSATVLAINFIGILARTGSISGEALNTYFDAFGHEGVLACGSLIVLLFQAARWGYTTFYAKTGHAWSPFVFISMLLGVQIFHDILFYYGVIQTIPVGKNEMIDVMKKYSKEHGPRALAAHAAFLILVGVLAMFFKERSVIFVLIATVFAFYILPFVITTFGPKPPPPPPPVPEKKASPDILGWNGPRY